jgi:hypothetical protein
MGCKAIGILTELKSGNEGLGGKPLGGRNPPMETCQAQSQNQRLLMQSSRCGVTLDPYIMHLALTIKLATPP